MCERELAAKTQMWTVTDRAREQGRGPTAGREWVDTEREREGKAKSGRDGEAKREVEVGERKEPETSEETDWAKNGANTTPRSISTVEQGNKLIKAIH